MAMHVVRKLVIPLYTSLRLGSNALCSIYSLSVLHVVDSDSLGAVAREAASKPQKTRGISSPSFCALQMHVIVHPNK